MDKSHQNLQSSSPGLLEEDAYNRIRKAIISGSYSPGDKLSIRGVSANLSVSPMPARAALRRLISEHALDATASGTAFVPRLSRGEFQELTLMRLQLEPLALRLAAVHVSDDLIDKLGTWVRLHEDALLAGDPKLMQQADTGFLFALYSLSNSPLLLGFIESLWLRRSPLFWEARWALLGSNAGRAPHRHGEIIAALRAGNVIAAENFLIDEIQTASVFLLEVMSFRQDDTTLAK